jgi:ABC-type transport system involved in Fe-S cluster assembly fused permease/ATPase subunit
MPLMLKYGINYLSDVDKIWMCPYIFSAWALFKILEVFFEGKRKTSFAKVVQKAWKDISHKAFNHLLHQDISTHQSNVKQQLYSMEKAKTGIENNLTFFSNVMIPLFSSLALSTVYLGAYCGWEFMATFALSFAAYLKYTNVTSQRRKLDIFKKFRYSALSNFMVGESLQNYQLVKHYNSEKIELAKFSALVEVIPHAQTQT